MPISFYCWTYDKKLFQKCDFYFYTWFHTLLMKSIFLYNYISFCGEITWLDKRYIIAELIVDKVKRIEKRKKFVSVVLKRAKCWSWSESNLGRCVLTDLLCAQYAIIIPFFLYFDKCCVFFAQTIVITDTLHVCVLLWNKYISRY